MKMCQPHWDTLRQNVIDEGLGDWIAPSAEVAMDQLTDEVSRGAHTKTNYDPLMNCHNMIMSRTLEMVGLYSLSEEFGCPICFFNTKRTEDGRCNCGLPDCVAQVPGCLPPFETWLEETPKACKVYMQEKGWIDAG